MRQIRIIRENSLFDYKIGQLMDVDSGFVLISGTGYDDNAIFIRAEKMVEVGEAEWVEEKKEAVKWILIGFNHNEISINNNGETKIVPDELELIVKKFQAFLNIYEYCITQGWNVNISNNDLTQIIYKNLNNVLDIMHT